MYRVIKHRSETTTRQSLNTWSRVQENCCALNRVQSIYTIDILMIIVTILVNTNTSLLGGASQWWCRCNFHWSHWYFIKNFQLFRANWFDWFWISWTITLKQALSQSTCFLTLRPSDKLIINYKGPVCCSTTPSIHLGPFPVLLTRIRSSTWKLRGFAWTSWFLFWRSWWSLTLLVILGCNKSRCDLGCRCISNSAGAIPVVVCGLCGYGTGIVMGSVRYRAKAAWCHRYSDETGS